MRLSTLFGLSAVTLAPAALGNRHGSNSRRHHELANRQESGVVKRGNLFSNAKFTWYDIGVAQVACEGWHSENDFVVAINALQYGTYWKSDYCGKQISITLNGKTATATVVDECMGCPWGGLDFTKGLFEYFADTGAGIIYGDWHFLDGSDSGSGSGDSATTSTQKAAATSTKVQVKASSKAVTSSAEWSPTAATWQPETTTWQPETTTWQPETTTWQPETTTWQPETTTWQPETTSTKVETTSKSKEPETTYKAPETTSEAPTSTWTPPTTSAKPGTTEKAATTSSAEPTASTSAKKCAARKRSFAPAHIPARRA